MFKEYRESFQSGNRIYRLTALISFLPPLLMFLGLGAFKYEIIGDGINFILLLCIFLSVLAFVFLIINLLKKTRPILIYFLLALSTFFLIPFIDKDENYYKISNKLSSPTSEEQITFTGELLQGGSIEINGRKAEPTGNIWKSNVPLLLGINKFNLSFKTSSGHEKFKKSINIERITPEELTLRKQKEAEDLLAKKRKAEDEKERAEYSANQEIKTKIMDELVRNCELRPGKVLKILKWNFVKDDLYKTAYFNVLVENPCPFAMKDFGFHVTYAAPSGTVMEGGWETVYDKLESGQKKWMRFSNNVWRNQSQRASLEIYSATKF
ncbi:hypothetical protein [Leptospira santarosai]|uniref:hypothetical protein n=1 Tax=Leptospira santarosai TaxID=28183 RepID=UPI000774092B|nr:hypothetical protein [Leptospira santarosai]